MSSAGVIPKEELSAYQRWEAPAVEGPLGDPPLISAKQLEMIGRQAHDEGFAEGRREGLAAGQTELATRVQALERLLGGLNAALAELDHAVEEELVELALAFARQIVRRELKLERGHIVGLVREALGQLALGTREAAVQLHPEDAALLREHFKPAQAASNLRIIEDLSLARGDCRVQSESARIDATVEARLAALAVAALGGERHDDERRG